MQRPEDRAARIESLEIEVVDAPAPEDLARLDAGLNEHARDFVPSSGFLPIAVLARDADARLCGGASGRVNWNWLHVSVLWVAPGLRRSGLGRALLRRIEDAARERGCHYAHLDTFSYQARAFYEKAGYERFGTLDDYPPGHQRFFLRKRLAP